MYQPRRSSRSAFVPIRKLRYHVRLWGEPRPGQPPLVMGHGWMDVAASWQFVVDAFAQDRFVIAPDWRGYGLTETPETDNYWFPDYLADLDFLLDHYAGGEPVDLVGHSMGGNVAMLYAGSRPRRIRRLVNLEGFGMPATRPSQAPERYGRWMDQLKAFHRGELALKAYDSAEGVAARLMKTNRRLARDKAEWLALHWARQGEDGRWHILGDPAHKIINAQLFRVDEVLALYQRIAAPLLWVQAAEDSLDGWHQGRFTQAEFEQRLAAVPSVQKAVIPEAGHMLHHDQPEVLAALIEPFLDA
ncbi:MAG TPA: alpha/beta hydrolase [Ramlibacter sp.]|nr:alpha/beta hydrolase [Ramlibacter sp.]